MSSRTPTPGFVSRTARSISRLITSVAPPLHSIRWKIFLLFMIVLILPLALVGYKIRQSIETSYLHSTEEGMIDTATVVAELYARLQAESQGDAQQLAGALKRVYANLDQTFQIKARLFGFTKNEVDTRIIAFDRAGEVVLDTAGIAQSGDDFSRWSDVRAALRGQYGSRWELDRARHRVNLYSTVPVFVGGKIVGAVSVSKPTNRVRNFIARQLKHLAVPIGAAVAMAAGLAFLLSGYITRTVAGLADKAERIASGEPNVRLETWSKSELGALARSVEKMRVKLEGRAYVEEMATNLSHELKTPLAAIRGAAEVLEDGAIDDPAARAKFLTNIQSEVQRLDRIVSELLKLSRIETHPADQAAEPIDAVEVLREIGGLYLARAEHLGIRFSSTLPGEPLPIKASGVQFRQMLANLLDNAMQFTPAGRAVAISAERVDGRAEIRVRDEGGGIEPDLLSKIFDRFFTTENPRTGNRGTGLGLAIVQSIVRVNEGTISVESELGKGTEFVVRFPLSS